ncbi:hypothetical protein BC829DRAFT_29807 [Chytridium lagenaria]|nr:hypothetical protein BC829DRAFT_29807 [Chytridium lagenaria]
MDQAEQDLLRQLFRENNDLRLKFNALQRELFNKTVQNEMNEEEIRQLKTKVETGGSEKSGNSRPTVTFPSFPPFTHDFNNSGVGFF